MQSLLQHLITFVFFLPSFFSLFRFKATQTKNNARELQRYAKIFTFRCYLLIQSLLVVAPYPLVTYQSHSENLNCIQKCALRMTQLIRILRLSTLQCISSVLIILNRRNFFLQTATDPTTEKWTQCNADVQGKIRRKNERRASEWMGALV